MNQVLGLENRIQHYAWGSPTAISALLGKRPSGEPEAELWIGAHPRCPSLAKTADGPVPLDALIAGHPDEILGPKVAARFGPTPPFLTKVLAAAQALSIQAHPTADRAREGFARENAAGVPLSAPHRNYRDANHKPELIVALTDFWALKGFLPTGELHAYLDGTGIEVMANSDNVLRGGLTPKHIDVAEMLAALTFEAGRATVLVPQERSPAERTYPTPDEEFELSEIRVAPGIPWSSTGDRNVEILFCVEGEGTLSSGRSVDALPTAQGMALLVPAATGQYRIEGRARIFRTAVRG